ncbi:hypothetical protein C0J52_20151 [Blattella germanica]|nr:hypothetical protein C0J52_20151 [Blattella germanica]
MASTSCVSSKRIRDAEILEILEVSIDSDTSIFSSEEDAEETSSEDDTTMQDTLETNQDVQRDIKEHLGVVGCSLSRHIRGRGMYRYAGGSATESSRLLVPEPVPAPTDFFNSAPARLGNEGQLQCYDSMAPSETATEATSYHDASSKDGISRQNSLNVGVREDELLIDFSPDAEEPKQNANSKVA